MGSLMALSNLKLGDPKRSNLRSLRLQGLISLKGAKIDPMVLLNINDVNRKPYMGSRLTPSHLTLNDFGRSRLFSF